MRIVKRSFSLLMKIIKFFLDEDIYVRASSLAYTTILSFIQNSLYFVNKKTVDCYNIQHVLKNYKLQYLLHKKFPPLAKEHFR